MEVVATAHDLTTVVMWTVRRRWVGATTHTAHAAHLTAAATSVLHWWYHFECVIVRMLMEYLLRREPFLARLFVLLTWRGVNCRMVARTTATASSRWRSILRSASSSLASGSVRLLFVKLLLTVYLSSSDCACFNRNI